MANNYFDFIGQNAGEEKKETPQQTQAMANVTVRCDADCFLLCDDEYLDIQLGAGKMAKIQVPIGQHLLEFLYTEDPDIKIEKEVDFPESGKSYLVIIKGLKELVDGANAEAQAKAAEAEAKKKAEEEARRKAEEELRILELQKEPYAVLSNNNTTLTFYYDHLKSDRNGMNIEDKKWKNHWDDIVTVFFDESFANCHNICSTGDWFGGFRNLTSVVGLKNLDTSKVTDMSSMFTGCQSLQSLDLSNFDTSKVTNMDSMFWGCHSLQSLDLSSFDTSKVTNMSRMFCDCESLRLLDLSSFDTSRVTSMFYMFCSCNSLESLDLSNFDTSKVTNMNSMFAGYPLQLLNLSSFDTSRVTSMGGMFSHCKSLDSLDLSNFDTSKVTDMSYMFSYCKSLRSLDLSSFDTSKVTDMTGMFNGCPIDYPKNKFNKI